MNTSQVVQILIFFMSTKALQSYIHLDHPAAISRILTIRANVGAGNAPKNIPRRFYVEPSNLFNIITASAQLLIRLGSGALTSGYKISIQEEDPKKYGVFKAFGKQISETSTTFSRRPAVPIELYEFEGCPFCKKVISL